MFIIGICANALRSSFAKGKRLTQVFLLGGGQPTGDGLASIILLIEEKNGRFAVCGMVAGIVSLPLALRGVMLGFLPWVCARFLLLRDLRVIEKEKQLRH